MRASTTTAINGENQRRQRQIDAATKTGALVQTALNACLAMWRQRVDDVQVLCSLPGCMRQRAHRDYQPHERSQGRRSLLAAFREGTYVWVAPRSHHCTTTAPDRFAMRPLYLPMGAVLVIDAGLVHAGAGDDCPPRVHAFSLPERRDRAATASSSSAATRRSGIHGSWHSRSDFGDQ